MSKETKIRFLSFKKKLTRFLKEYAIKEKYSNDKSLLIKK